METEVFTVPKGTIRCHCKWKEGSCWDAQIHLHEHEPEGMFTGYVETRVPPKLKQKLADGSPLTKHEKKKYHILERVAKTCDVELADLLNNKVVYLSKSHWRKSAHEYAQTVGKSLMELHQFQNRRELENATGIFDKMDIFEPDEKHNPLLASLVPNHTEKEWPLLYNKYIYESADNRESRTSQRETKRNEERPVSEWMDDIERKDAAIAEKDAKIASLLRQIKELKNDKQQLQTAIVKQKSDKSDLKKKNNYTERKLRGSKADASSLQQQLEGVLSDKESFILTNLCQIDTMQGNFTRLTMFDESFHAMYKDVCREFYGFASWSECIAFVRSTMPEVDIEFSRPIKIKYNDDNVPLIVFQNYTNFEQLMIARMFFHLGWNRNKMGVVISGLDRRRVGEFIDRWGPRWAKVGQYLSILDIDEEYLVAERPLAYEMENMLYTAALLDGKDYLTDTIRKDKTHGRTQVSNKSGNHATAREMCCTTPSGLCFLYCRHVGGKCEENDTVQIMGGKGPDYVNLDTFKDVANNPNEKADLLYRTAIDDYLDQRKLLLPLESDDSDDDDDDENDNNDSSSNTSVASEGGEGEEQDANERPIFDNGVKDVKTEPTVQLTLEQMEAELKEFEQTNGGKIKSATVRTSESLEEEARRFIREQSPTCKPAEKLAQMEMHERLHCEFEKGNIGRCSLSFYLKFMTPKRRKLLHYMGSTMAEESWNDPNVELPEKFPVGLTMIPKGWRVLADKGFTYVTRHFPNLNAIDTPARLGKRKFGRYSEEEVKKSKKKCKLRYTCEVFFRRVTEEEVLRDRIPYRNFAILPHAQAWAHAYGNLKKPLALPANHGNYFPTQKDANDDDDIDD